MFAKYFYVMHYICMWCPLWTWLLIFHRTSHIECDASFLTWCYILNMTSYFYMMLYFEHDASYFYIIPHFETDASYFYVMPHLECDDPFGMCSFIFLHNTLFYIWRFKILFDVIFWMCCLTFYVIPYFEYDTSYFYMTPHSEIFFIVTAFLMSHSSVNSTPTLNV